jgi:hypothetical protein
LFRRGCGRHGPEDGEVRLSHLLLCTQTHCLFLFHVALLLFVEGTPFVVVERFDWLQPQKIFLVLERFD